MNRGFTLLELLLVLALASVMLGLAALMLGDNPGRQLQDEQERLAAVLRAAAAEAQLQRVELGLGLHRDGYRFFVLDSESRDWQALERRPLQPHDWPAGVRVTLQVEGEPAPLDATAATRPHLLLLSSGEVTPFELAFEHPGVTLRPRLWSDGINLLALDGAH